jgi:AraC-like DNA-binding protein
MVGTQLIQIFILIGAAQGFILGVSMLGKGGGITNKLLALAFLTLSIRLSFYPFVGIFNFPFWTIGNSFSLILLLVIGPAIFLFTRFKLFPDRRLSVLHLFHLVPVCVYLIHLIFPVFYLPVPYPYATLFSAIFYGLLSLYVLLIYTLRKRKKLISKVIDQSKLYSFALPLLVIPIAILILVNYSCSYFGLHSATIPYLGLTVGLYRMGFKSTLNSKYLSNEILGFESKQQVEIDKDKLLELVSIVENEQLYLDNALNIQKLSLKTNLSRHEISQLLNIGLDKNYNDFINGYRVEASKVRLVDAGLQNLSIEGIAMESGFNSKSTFNQVFKSQTGLTPSEYKRKFTANPSN